ncbi:putative hemin ABC transporter, permease protein [gamma proteobacterium HTCC2207]|uniref:Putative hemin ABC transporter, permease protein n=1 Tax=gamma proteobacterium HTCC2207 TaxID=314287 RepID=Q1YQS9_9GAMM|nr:putative hemin ABC transporter, permease protein [gamma proteobacterium HTCC2207]MBT5106742.1 iron ABC transporter permease [Porticoccaceae bacterium]MBT6592994.1 iron ABC transporter permease [Porticoccaceae bacterium]MDB9706431.1 iron ABC transporter permease [Porticoccaceae bacterium]MDB9805593.1 iron ABC transporter permease [Porticoccaceae bacterium]
MRRISSAWLLATLAILLPVIVLYSMTVGTVSISMAEAFSAAVDRLFSSADSIGQTQVILFDIRLPRILLALLVGAILASTGAVMQGLFRNPLADPSLIGVSGGASVGASLMIVLAGGAVESGLLMGLSLVALGAFVGGFAATILVYRLATSGIGTSVTTMLLAGIAIGALAGALNSLLSYFADNDMLRQISLWQMGNLSAANWAKVWIMALVSLLLLVSFPRDSRALNALLLGESEARHLGIDVQRVKRRLIVLTALGVGVSVALAGMVGFVGLVIPHVIRLLIGPDHRWLIPGSAMAGAILLVVADSLARVVVLPAELPTGILTALLGAPFFIALLLQQRREV